ncbi:MAG TPA: hypothetical protein VHR97_11205 [Candidatus Baltobacteraceae bacterium]|jgi:hypothetical protein|nr:hypothetical protein [Candidatus Baltobacteraceae bacterium]
MPRGKKNPVAELPQIHVDDRVIIVADGPRKGQDGTVVEVNAKKKSVRLSEWGWVPMADVEVIDGGAQPQDAAAKAAADAEAMAPTLRTPVDGADAQIVLDGTSGGPHEESMIKPPLDDLVHSLARANVALIRATQAKQRANEEHKDAQGTFNAVAAEIVQHYGEVEQLGLDLQPAKKNGKAPADSAGDPDEEDEPDEGADSVRIGSARSFKGAEGPY